MIKSLAKYFFILAIWGLMSLPVAARADGPDFERGVALLEAAEKKLDLPALKEAERIFIRECQGPSRDSLCEYYLGRVYLAQYTYWSRVQHDDSRAESSLAKAESFGRQAASRRPNDPAVHVLLGKIYQVKLSRYPVSGITQALLAESPVVEEYRKALELDPDNGEAEMGLGIYYLFIPGFLGGDGHRARTHFKRAHVLMPGNPEPAVWVAISYRQQGRLEDARNWLDRAKKRAPDDPFVQAEDKRLREEERKQGR